MKKLFFILFLLIVDLGQAQVPKLSPLSKISVLTVGIDTELQAKFGHTAIRIEDPSTGMDIVFGYGGFDFEAPFFYWKFTTGKLDYSMTGHRFNHFMETYRYENRSVTEQPLNLSQDERNQLFKFLQENYRPENRLYKYDFLFDNCATRIPEVLKMVFANKLKYDYLHIEDPLTFRQLIHESLETNSWSTFGIDLALGSVIDKKATPWEHQFLPIYVSQQLQHTTINNQKLTSKDTVLFEQRPTEFNNNFFLSPLFWLLILLLIVLTITYRDYKHKSRTRWLDFVLFFSTGIAGLLICFLWFITDHYATKNNLNILWAVPINLYVSFLLAKTNIIKKWLKHYLKVLLATIILIVPIWLFKIQVFSPLLILVLIILGVRYLFLINWFKNLNSLKTDSRNS